MKRQDKTQRFITIDLLRGFAIILVIITHTAAYFLSNKSIFMFWNFLHFSVPMLVFCSGYVLFAKYNNADSIKGYLSFLKKRLIRLLKPFYIFLIFFFILRIIEHRFNGGLVWQSIRILYPDIAWLVLLFVQLTLLFPLCLYIIKRRLFVWLSMVFLCALGIGLIFFKPQMDYRWYMGIPWLLPFVLSYFYKKYIEGNRSYQIIATTFFICLFLIQYVSLQHLGHDLVLQNNKYPPNLYYLSYALSWLFGLTVIFNNSRIQKILTKPFSFFSIHSFSLYFIHYILIELLSVYRVFPINFWTFSIVVLGGSILIQLAFDLFLFNIKKRELILGNR